MAHVPKTPDVFAEEPNFGNLKMPSSKFDKPVIVDNHDGTITFKYDPKEIGTHELYIKYNRETVQGSPYKFHVDSVGSGPLTAYGCGLVQGVAGEPCTITVSNKNSSSGKIDVSVEGPSKPEVTCHDNKDGTMSVVYVPPSPGEYKVTIKAGNHHIKGSPFTAKVTAEGRKRSQITLGHSSEVSLNVQEKDFKCLNASIVAPSGLEEPCFLKKREKDGSLGISFTPREEGEHLVNVKKLGKHLAGSPFKINVLVKDIGNASNVKVTGNGIREGKTHTENQLVLHTNDAGFGGVNFSVEGRSTSELKCEDKGDGIIVCSYKPTEPGYYVINLKFADHHIPGSPYTVKVTGPGSNIVRETIKRKVEQAPIADIGQEARLCFKLPGTNAFDMAAKVTNPTSVTDDAVIVDLEECLYGVFFTPKEPGVHTVSVKCKDIHIPGSPFQYTVGSVQGTGAHKVHAGGLGLERGGANEPLLLAADCFNFQLHFKTMSEYMNLLGKCGMRFTGSPITLSPQLDDYGIENILHPVSSKRGVQFRVILYVPTLEQNELRINFPADDTMEVHMEHGQRKMAKRHQQLSWSRDCRYLFKLPEGVSKSCVTATWTHDSFLIIQSRSQRPVTVYGEKEDEVDQIVPSRVCGILRPHLDLSIIKDMMWLHQSEVDEICNYLETRGMVPETHDVLGMLKRPSGKLQQCKKSQVSKRLDKETETGDNLELEKTAECQEGKDLEESMEVKESTSLAEESEEKQSSETTQEKYEVAPVESLEGKGQKSELESVKSEIKLEPLPEHQKDESVMETDTTL
ncbi:hypothetical protein JTE90_006382 [Oedothorax gibbosus]|uniref:Uncharacterized protein n=1 Tax=Oedothorax gibbosus TaxID=931172 RepID=A0AAV6VZ12_9ARAC|nr:hypothetical protein JTE90_006382 [Oedothorax gibbosus]